MNIVRVDVPVSTIERFADEHGLTMEVHERGKGVDPNKRYYAHFRRAEVAGDGVLIGTFGNGPTPNAAIASYAMVISEETLVINGNHTDERRIRVPRLVSERAFKEMNQST